MKPKPICTSSGTSRVQNVSNWQHVFQHELKVFAVVKFTASLQKIIHILKKKKVINIKFNIDPVCRKFQLKSVQRYLGVLQRKPPSWKKKAEFSLTGVLWYFLCSYSWLLWIPTGVLRNRSVYRLVGSEDFGCGTIKFTWSPLRLCNIHIWTPSPPENLPRRPFYPLGDKEWLVLKSLFHFRSNTCFWIV